MENTKSEKSLLAIAQGLELLGDNFKATSTRIDLGKINVPDSDLRDIAKKIKAINEEFAKILDSKGSKEPLLQKIDMKY